MCRVCDNTEPVSKAYSSSTICKFNAVRSVHAPKISLLLSTKWCLRDSHYDTAIPRTVSSTPRCSHPTHDVRLSSKKLTARHTASNFTTQSASKWRFCQNTATNDDKCFWCFSWMVNLFHNRQLALLQLLLQTHFCTCHLLVNEFVKQLLVFPPQEDCRRGWSTVAWIYR